MAEQIVALDLPACHSAKQRMFQEFFIQDGIEEIWGACGTKFGKALHIDTPIPTPSGWRTMGDLKEGDFVFDETGAPTRVEFATDVMYGHECYKVVFSDGSSIIADEEHLWTTKTHNERKNIARVMNPKDRVKSTNSSAKTRTTKEILETLYHVDRKKNRPNHSIPCVSGPLQYPEKNLPIAPYMLGVWLGDGTTLNGSITTADFEVIEEIAKDQHVGRKVQSDKYLWRVAGLTAILRINGFLGNKHVPDDYLISSPMQRLALLQGLMDTDGTISSRGDCTFDNTNKLLADAVEALCISLGIKVTRNTRIPKLNGVEHKVSYRVFFTTDLPVFRIPRKLARIRKVSLKARHRYIVEIVRVESVPVRCIRVANASHLYLAGRACIPTHNTMGIGTGMVVGMMNLPLGHFKWIAPLYSQAEIGYDYIKSMLPPAPYAKSNNTKLKILLPDSGAKLDCYHSQDPVALEGHAIDGYVFDEAAKQDGRAAETSVGTQTRKGIKRAFVSTPFGKNWFYQGCMQAQDEMRWAIKKGRRPTKLFIRARTVDNPFIDPRVIESARRKLPEYLFRQYYLAEFMDQNNVFSSFRKCLYGPDIVTFEEDFTWHSVLAKGAEVVIGVDWAKSVDYTVFCAIDVMSRKVVGIRRFHKKEYTQAVAELVRFTRKFKDTLIVLHDKTGVGTAIDELLGFTNLCYQGLTFTNNLKAQMVNNVITLTEREMIGIPRWNVMESELEAYGVTVTPSGNFVYGAPPGAHDDVVTALMLSCQALSDFGDMNLEVKLLEELNDELGKDKLVTDGIEAYYQSIIDEQDEEEDDD